MVVGYVAKLNESSWDKWRDHKDNIIDNKQNKGLRSGDFFYEFTYLLTPWSRILLEKLTGFAANQEIPRILLNGIL